jgi:CheY-like chemotaxis protein
LWATQRVAELIHRLFGVRYHQVLVGRVLAQLGWGCQRPVGLAKDVTKPLCSAGSVGSGHALKKVQNLRSKLESVFVDVQMPYLDGFELTKQSEENTTATFWRATTSRTAALQIRTAEKSGESISIRS